MGRAQTRPLAGAGVALTEIRSSAPGNRDRDGVLVFGGQCIRPGHGGENYPVGLAAVGCRDQLASDSDSRVRAFKWVCDRIARIRRIVWNGNVHRRHTGLTR